MRSLFTLLIPVCLLGQSPRVGVIEFYGAENASPAELRRALGVKPGEPLPGSKADVEERLERLDAVVRASLLATCCEAGRAILYVGIELKGAPHFELRDRPQGAAEIPADIVPVYMKFIGAVSEAARGGSTSEDLTRGHSLMADPTVRAIQESFIDLANQHLPVLRAVLRECPDDEQRAMAAYVIGYASNKKGIVDDLLLALRDPDTTVRANAMRGLAALAVHQRLHPDSGVKVSPTWIVEMLNSIEWTDRHNAAVTLVTLTDTRDETVLALLRERALPALVNMASWQHLPHALPGYILLGRIAGMSETALRDAWAKGQRASVIGKFQTKK